MNEEQMKSYHLTQEQVLEIASNLELDGRDITVWTDGYVEFETKTALQLFANAVLDQVLGEPVAEVIGQKIHSLDWDYEHIKNLRVGTKLYAPKEQS